MTTQHIEFHVVADSTGDTAARVARATAAPIARRIFDAWVLRNATDAIGAPGATAGAEAGAP